MDKDNKYYGTIEKLVKQHRKYPEYEAILDEIIDDVYAHSEVIINSVTNESVIEAYLQKVIATSMITVPKKLGVRKYVRPMVITPVKKPEPELEIVEQKEEDTVSLEPATVIESEKAPEPVPEKETEPEIKVNTELVDKMINLAETPKDDFQELWEESLSGETNESSEPIENNETLQISEEEEFVTVEKEIPDFEGFKEDDFADSFAEPEQKEEVEEEKITEDFPELIDTEGEMNFTTEEVDEKSDEEELLNSAFTQEITEEPETPEESDVSEASDEIAANDVTFAAESEEINTFGESVSEDSDLNLVYEDIRETDEDISFDNNPDFQDTDTELEIDDDTVSKTVSVDFIPQETEILEIDDTEINTEQEQITELSDFNNSNELLIENNISEAENLLSETDNLINESQENELLSTFDSVPDLTELPDTNITLAEVESDELISSDIDDGLQSENITDDFLEEVQDVKVKETVYQKTDFSVFAPNEDIVSEEIDSGEDIAKSLFQLDKKYANLNIINVFNMRYKQNYSVKQIREELNMELTDVYSALSKISDIL
ncbi:hypothetical protein IKQ21_08900 [bacterium]|nr:hypothetical protein [bacterium]